MSLTLTDLQEKLKGIDEISLMEILDISSEDIVMRFIDKIEENFENLCEDLEKAEVEWVPFDEDEDIEDLFEIEDEWISDDRDEVDEMINNWIDKENNKDE